MLIVDTDKIAHALDYPRLVAALRLGHRRGVDAVERVLLSEAQPPTPINHFLVLPAWRHGDVFGAKLVSVFPANGPPTPSIQNVYVLFDGRDGSPLACITGSTFTLRKTAADSALGASFLAGSDVADLLMVGAGNQARHQIAALCAMRPSIRRVAIWNRTPDKARRLAAELDPGIETMATSDLEGAVRRADIICCATSAAAPLVRGAWLKPGTHVDLVGGFTNDMREADDEAIGRASVFVDSRWFTIGLCGDISGPIAAGVITEADIKADLFELCAGRHAGRRSAEEITVFKNAGGAHLDLMVGQFIHELAVAGALG